MFFWMRRQSVMRFGCHYPMKLNSFGHCICVHRGNIVAAAGHKLGTPGLRVNELSRSHKMNNLYVVSRELVYVYLVPVFCA